MTQQNQLHSVQVQDITFNPPSPEAYRVIRKDHIRSWLGGAVFFGIILILGTYFTIQSRNPYALVVLLPLLGLEIYMFRKMLGPFECGVRFGTVIEYCSKQVVDPGSDTDSTYRYVTIRLDDTGELIHNLVVTLHIPEQGIEDVPVMLCRKPLRKSNQYHVFSTVVSEHPFWDDPNRTARLPGGAPDMQDRFAPDPSAYAPVTNEATIRDIPFRELPPELHQQISKRIGQQNGLVQALAILILLPVAAAIFVMEPEFFTTYWYISAPILLIVAALIVLVWRRENKTGQNITLLGAFVRIESCKWTSPLCMTLMSEETGQTLVDQRIDISYCGKNPEGMRAVLVRTAQNYFAIYPTDIPF